MATTYSRKRKASCLEIVVSTSKERISRDVVKNIILPMLHTKFNWAQVMGELTLVCYLSWNESYQDYKQFIKRMIFWAKRQSSLDYTGLAKMNASPNTQPIRECMEHWYFKH
jgi:hypothetical protein